MYSITAAVLFSVIAVLTLLVAFGLPLGELTMGGQHKILPAKMRVMAGLSFIIQLFAVIIILQAGGFTRLWFTSGTTKGICIFFAVYLSLNTVMNALSKSRKERFIMTPLSLITAICFWVTAVSLQIHV